jgi:hemerythrin
MPLINWTPAFSVSVHDMDVQHQLLIEILNQLHDAMRGGKGSQEIGKIVDKMIDYAQRHFRDEEKLLAANHYPQYANQKAEHDAFILKALEFKRDVSQGKMALSVPVSNYLKEWWTSHIQKEDKLYGTYLNTLGVK